MKNEFVVTWLTITKWWLALVPKTPLPPDVAAFEVVLLLEPHASSTVAAIAAAPPVSAARRVIWRQRFWGVSSCLRSSHSSRSMAS